MVELFPLSNYSLLSYWSKDPRICALDPVSGRISFGVLLYSSPAMDIISTDDIELLALKVLAAG